MPAGIRRGMNTLDNIHKAAKKEFLDKGFQMASLRNIVKNAGVTTGAFYGYYKSKEELFDALVGKQYEHIMKMYIDVQNGFKKLDANTQQTSMGEVAKDCMDNMLDYMYENEDEFRLILLSSKAQDMRIWCTRCQRLKLRQRTIL